MVPSVSPTALNNEISGYGKLIDVRSAAEYAVGHIPGAINVPLEQVEARAADIGEGPVLMICEVGTRAAIAAGWMKSGQAVSVLEGGTAAWRKAGLPLVTCAPSRWALERQVRLVAGVIVLVATLLAVVVNPKWVFLAMFVGAGLTFAGATNICGMAAVLARMPWNRDSRTRRAAITGLSEGCPL
jgi:rhodanese-related sulfurtransferase